MTDYSISNPIANTELQIRRQEWPDIGSYMSNIGKCQGDRLVVKEEVGQVVKAVVGITARTVARTI